MRFASKCEIVAAALAELLHEELTAKYEPMMSCLPTLGIEMKDAEFVDNQLVISLVNDSGDNYQFVMKPVKLVKVKS